MLSVNWEPAEIGGVGAERLNTLVTFGLTVKLADVPATKADVAVIAVFWASKSVIVAVPTPPVKFTEAGYCGVFPKGDVPGPVKVKGCRPVNVVTVLPKASVAVIVSVNAPPAVGDGVESAKLLSGPGLTVSFCVAEAKPVVAPVSVGVPAAVSP